MCIRDSIYSDSLSEMEVIRIIASLEKGSSHVLAEAFGLKAQELNLKLEDASEFESLSGLGIKVKLDGKEYLVGNLRMMKEKMCIRDRVLTVLRGCIRIVLAQKDNEC